MQIKAFLKGILWGLFLALIGVGMGYYTPNRSLESLKNEYTYPESAFISVLGMDVHYREVGRGQPLLLLHGTGASLHTWNGWTQELRDSFRVVSVDLPAFGLTGPHPDRDYGIPAYVNFLEAFAKKIQLDSFSLAGNSLGGLIAWNYALEHPQKVKRLILIDAAGFPEKTKSPLAIRLARNPFLGSLLRFVTPKDLFERSLRSVYGNPEQVTPQLVDQYYQLFRRPGNRQAFIDRSRTDYDAPVDRLKELSMPCLVQWGEKDTWISPDRAADFGQFIPHARIIRYPELGHVPMEENPDLTANDVRVFLKGH